MIRWTSSTIGLVAASNSFGTMILSTMARPQVGLVAQCNVVTWDPASKIEHLVQSSAFMSQTRRFEFLVPTPTLPKVQEVGDAPISFVSNLINPPRPVSTTPEPEAAKLDPNYGVLIRPPVEVKKIALIGNLKATTILASDIVALADWMDKNGYKTSLTQKAWLEKYVQKRWYITAFQVNSDSDALKTSSVRLSFRTELPYVPYTSPRNSWVAGLKQEIFLVTPKAMQGTTNGKSLWTGALKGHAFLSNSATTDFGKKMGLQSKDIPSQSWVSRFIDQTTAETSNDDLYFIPMQKGTKPK